MGACPWTSLGAATGYKTVIDRDADELQQMTNRKWHVVCETTWSLMTWSDLKGNFSCTARCLRGTVATFSKLLRRILGKDSYLIDDLGKTAILKTSQEKNLRKSQEKLGKRKP